MNEPRISDDLDAILRGDTEFDYDKPAEEPLPGPPPSNEAEIGKGKGKRSKVSARPVVPPLSPRRTRTGLRSQPIQPKAVPAALRTTSKAKTKATATNVAAAVLKPVLESQVFDEFVANSDDGDEGEMREVETNLQITAHSRGSSLSHIWLYDIIIIINPCVDLSGYTLQDHLRTVKCTKVVAPRTRRPSDIYRIRNPTMP